MKIVIDAHTFSPFQIAGVSRYIYNLLMMLSRIDRENSYIVLANAFNLRWKTHIYAALLKVCGANFEIRLSSIPTSLSNRLFDFIWFRCYLPRVLHEEKPDLLFAPDFVLPPRHVANRVKRVVTVHDIVPALFPHLADMRTWYAFRTQVRASIASADLVLTDSEASARDIRRWAKLADEKVVPVHLAADDVSETPAPRDARRRIEAEFGLTEPFLLFVGTIEPRKNLSGLIHAFAAAQRMKNIPHRLVVLGKRGWRCADVYRLPERLGVGGKVKFLGYVPREELLNFYAAADALIYPSFYEGFGLPVLEAMTCGTPVVASNRGALPEIANGAALLVEPCDIGDMAEAILRIIADSDLRRRLRSRGLERAREFSWEKTARMTLDMFERAAR